MRISDWSSDVCSSDLADERFVGGATGVSLAAQPGGDALIAGDQFGQILADQLADVRRGGRRGVERLELRGEQVELDADAVDQRAGGRGECGTLRLQPDFGAAGELLEIGPGQVRSEEHTSELQSLMR